MRRCGVNDGVEESDIRLIRRAKGGDAEAFTQLVHNYKNYVWQIALGVLGDEMEAEDVTQETFVRAFFSLKMLREEVTFPSWIATVATRLAIDTARRQSRQVVTHADIHQVVDVDTTNRFDEIENQMVLTDLMNALTEDERTVLVLRELQGLSYQELSDILQIPLGTVRSRLHNARQSLKRIIANQGDAK